MARMDWAQNRQNRLRAESRKQRLLPPMKKKLAKGLQRCVVCKLVYKEQRFVRTDGQRSRICERCFTRSGAERSLTHPNT